MHRLIASNRVRTVAALVITAGCLGGLAWFSGQPTRSGAETNASDYTGPIRLMGVLRDFRASNVSNGHPDFEMNLPNGRGIYAGIVADNLDVQGRPAFASTGTKVSSQGADTAGRPIVGPKPHIEARAGDTPPSLSSATGAVTSEASFSQWFMNVHGVNDATLFPVVLARTGSRWSFDGDLRTQFASLRGSGRNKVYSYTYAVETRFVYKNDGAYTVTAGADDAMWVYIDGKLVIDLGGAHDFAEQTIDLSRLGLSDGQEYPLHIFYAERDRKASRFKFDTNIPLSAIDAPQVSGLAD